MGRFIAWDLPHSIGEPTQVECIQRREGWRVFVQVTGSLPNQGEGMGRVLGPGSRFTFRMERQVIVFLILFA